MTMNITRKDAIKTLHELWRETNDSWYKEVFNMAIDALSESSGDLISRAEAIKAVRKELVCDGRHETHDKVCRFIADVLLTALPSAKGGDAEMNESKPQYYMQVSPSNGADLISRADAIEAIVNTGSKVAYRDASESVLFGSAFRQKEIIDIINALPSAEAPTDLISREAAIEAVAEDLASVLNVSKDETRELAEHALAALPSAEAETDEENELKFYYVESIDDYWVGRRLDNFYYANWHNGLGFVWSHSRYLPWGEHIVDENTLWKEHTYPSEPIEIPFTEWVVGFVKKYFTEPKTAEWIPCSNEITKRLI